MRRLVLLALVPLALPLADATVEACAGRTAAEAGPVLVAGERRCDARTSTREVIVSSPVAHASWTTTRAWDGNWEWTRVQVAGLVDWQGERHGDERACLLAAPLLVPAHACALAPPPSPDLRWGALP